MQYTYSFPKIHYAMYNITRSRSIFQLNFSFTSCNLSDEKLNSLQLALNFQQQMLEKSFISGTFRLLNPKNQLNNFLKKQNGNFAARFFFSLKMQVNDDESISLMRTLLLIRFIYFSSIGYSVHSNSKYSNQSKEIKSRFFLQYNHF